MKPKSNARQVPLNKNAELLILATLGEYPSFQKEADLASQPDHEPDSTKPKRIRNKPTAIPEKKSVNDPAAPRPEAVAIENISTPKKQLTAEQFYMVGQFSPICSGLVYFSRNGFNRSGIGVAQAYVAFKSIETWALYIGHAEMDVETMTKEGEKIVNREHLQQIISCDESAMLLYIF